MNTATANKQIRIYPEVRDKLAEMAKANGRLPVHELSRIINAAYEQWKNQTTA